MDCIYKDVKRKQTGGCTILDTTVCNPERCIWRKTAPEYLLSLHKARINYIRRHGKDEYTKYVPNSWVELYKTHEMIENEKNLIENEVEN